MNPDASILLLLADLQRAKATLLARVADLEQQLADLQQQNPDTEPTEETP